MYKMRDDNVTTSDDNAEMESALEGYYPYMGRLYARALFKRQQLQRALNRRRCPLLTWLSSPAPATPLPLP